MIKLSLLSALAASVSFAHAGPPDRFNILSLDSAKYKGYMTANYVDTMER